MEDKYQKLKPVSSSKKLCKCKVIPEIYLTYEMGNNPIHCVRCSKEIHPKYLKFPESLIDQIADWHKTYAALYHLWLDGGEYEKYAWQKLGDPNSQINKKGLELVKELSEIRPCYYLWFMDGDLYNEPFNKCPVCRGPLADKAHNYSFCRDCKVLI